MRNFLKNGQFNNETPQQRKKEIRWLRARAKQSLGLIGTISTLSLIGTAMGLGGAVATKYLIDAVTGQKTQALWTAAAFVVVLTLGSILLRGVSSRVSASAHVRSYNRNQRWTFDRILRADWEALEPYRSGDLLHRLSADVNAVSDGTISMLPNLLTLVIRFGGAFLIMLYFDPAMALIALLGIPATFLISRLLMGSLRKRNQQVKELGGEVMSFQEDAFRNLTSIKAFSVVDLFTDELHKLQGTYSDAYLSYNASQIKISTVMSLISTLVSGACFCWGVFRLWTGQMTFGSLTMFMQLAGTLRSSFSSLISLIQQGISLATSAGRLMAVEELPEEEARIPEGLKEESSVKIYMEQTTFSYRDGGIVLHPFDFHAEYGDQIAITGPSGEGKTTLLRLLLGLVQPVTGEAVLEGTSGNRYPLSAGTRRLFAYVPQGNSIFTGTVAQNLRLGNLDATDEEMKTALETACAWDFVEALPGGLEHPLTAGGRGISEGQAQRIAIARALLKKAPILLLDEATSAMDLALEQQLMKNLKNCGLIHTCILVTHRPGSTAFCSRAYEVHEGHVTEVL